jgi:hypothetical protein
MSQATDMLAMYIDAEKKVLQGKQVTITTSIGSRSYTLENLQEIIKGRKEWQAKVNAEAASSQGGSSLYSVADFSQ